MDSISCSAGFNRKTEGTGAKGPDCTPSGHAHPGLFSCRPDKANYLSCAIIAWNEEASLPSMLQSLFEQSLFAELKLRGQHCEIFCLANGCTDNTVGVAEKIFAQNAREHPHRNSFSCSVVTLDQRGKFNAWNQFVHRLSAREAGFLFLLDADILLHRKETLWNMLARLESAPEASVTVDRPCKDILFKSKKNLSDRLSLSMSHLTGSASAQLCAQLYCIRSKVARNIYLPKDLGACEDGFIKALVCTDFLSHEVRPARIQIAEGAVHTFEAYTSCAAVIRNQKRQALGQTIVHLLLDEYLPGLPPARRANLAAVLRENDVADPGWLKRLIAQHLRQVRFFWRLYPGLLSHRFRRLANLALGRKLICLPSVLAGSAAGLLGSFMAYRALRKGCTDYWPSSKKLGPPQLSSQFTTTNAVSIHPK